ncbi:MAG: ABC transporter substrate-binding protein [Gammaproteobacteria bacterium]|jgi:zinc transport system substrate-binding protein|nr:ABC transporter substrate-binding protein [Gammaproteobacteria bacterium]
MEYLRRLPVFLLRRAVVLLLAWLTALPAAAEGPRVVASTSWAGAVVRAAGVTEVRVISPPALQHPPEYEPRPSDLLAVAEADYVVLGGFERFAERLREAVGSRGEVIQVRLDHDPAVTDPEVRRLAARIGDPVAAERNLAALAAERARFRVEVAEALGGKRPRTLVHRFLGAWARLAGLEVVGTFAAGPARPSDLLSLTGERPELVLDNAHAPGGAELAEAAGVPRVVLVNFPGPELDLAGVLRENARRFREGLGEPGRSTAP